MLRSTLELRLSALDPDLTSAQCDSEAKQLPQFDIRDLAFCGNDLEVRIPRDFEFRPR